MDNTMRQPSLKEVDFVFVDMVRESSEKIFLKMDKEVIAMKKADNILQRLEKLHCFSQEALHFHFAPPSHLKFIKKYMEAFGCERKNVPYIADTSMYLECIEVDKEMEHFLEECKILMRSISRGKPLKRVKNENGEAVWKHDKEELKKLLKNFKAVIITRMQIMFSDPYSLQTQQDSLDEKC